MISRNTFTFDTVDGSWKLMAQVQWREKIPLIGFFKLDFDSQTRASD